MRKAVKFSFSFSIIAILVASIMFKWKSEFNAIITRTSGDIDVSGVPVYSQWSPAFSITNNFYYNTQHSDLTKNQENEGRKNLIIADQKEQLRSMKHLLKSFEERHKKDGRKSRIIAEHKVQLRSMKSLLKSTEESREKDKVLFRKKIQVLQKTAKDSFNPEHMESIMAQYEAKVALYCFRLFVAVLLAYFFYWNWNFCTAETPVPQPACVPKRQYRYGPIKT